MKRDRFFLLIAAIALLGLLVAGYQLKEHYAETGESFCNFNGQFNCDVVNKSEFAVLLGVPIAAWGMLYYAGLLTIGLAHKRLKKLLSADKSLVALLLFCYAGVGLLFTLYLTTIEAFVLRVFCPLCLASAALVFLAAGMAFAHWREQS